MPKFNYDPAPGNEYEYETFQRNRSRRTNKFKREREQRIAEERKLDDPILRDDFADMWEDE